MNAIVSAKGQVTIPKRLRDRLGIRAGDELDFEEEEGRLIVRKVARAHPVDPVFGILRSGPGRSTNRLIEEMRGNPDAV